LFNSVSNIVISLHHAFGQVKNLTEIHSVLASFQADSLLVLFLIVFYFYLVCSRRYRLTCLICIMGGRDLNSLKWTYHPLPYIYLNIRDGHMVTAVSKHGAKVVSI
jgi:hypothetical protein